MSPAITMVVALSAGGVVGAAYFALLWWSVRSLTDGRILRRTFVLAWVLRFGMVAGALGLLFRHGVDPMLVLREEG